MIASLAIALHVLPSELLDLDDAMLASLVDVLSEQADR
jgi:hypothetical protein